MTVKAIIRNGRKSKMKVNRIWVNPDTLIFVRQKEKILQFLFKKHEYINHEFDSLEEATAVFDRLKEEMTIRKIKKNDNA